MINEARELAGKLRRAYGYSATLNMTAAQCLDALAAELEQAEERESGLSIMLTSAQSAAETYKREREAGQWISVKDRLPEIDVQVLTLDKRGRVSDRRLHKFVSGPLVFSPDGQIPGKHITHWMPMPEPPKEEYAK